LLRLVLLACLLVCIALRISASSRQPAEPSSVAPSYLELCNFLLIAVREGDHQKVSALLESGASANARNEGGDTALMEASLNSDLRMMRLLMEHGADINARGVYEVPTLLRAVHDPEKVELLLAHGARIDERAMVIAAMISGSKRTLQLIRLRGGSVNAQVGGYTALMAAAYCGDLDSAIWLVEQGADVNARTEAGCTALNGAAISGQAGIVKLLLDRGADPNVRYEEPDTIGDFQTPALSAAWKGHADCLRLLLEHGAEANVQGGPFKRTPLLCAATSGSAESVRLLLANGAHLNVKDWKDDTPLDWARRRGKTSIVEMLQQAGGTPRVAPAVEPHRSPSPQTVRSAISASLPLLQRSGQKITQTKGCVTCHQHALVAMTVNLARARQIPVDESIAEEERRQAIAVLSRKRPLLLLGSDLDATLAAYSLVGFGSQLPSGIRDALVHYLVLHQREDGHWATEANRPPDDASAFLFTALAVRGLREHAPPGRGKEIAARVAKARVWLLKNKPTETVDSAFQLLGLKWADASSADINQAADALLRQQREDGGWGQLPTLPSDAYATGQVLFALNQGGGLPADSTRYLHGVRFLLETQLADGSWFVPTRCFPVLEYTSSGFPHGRSQFISASATCWATMALMLAEPSRR
jgi:ankyrin repeat protein